MTVSSCAPARMLFLLSNDFGELSNALYVLSSQPFAREATLLLPPRIYRGNEQCIPGQVRQYSTLPDILGAVDDIAPDIVFLFSGYLFTINELFDLDEFTALIEALHARECVLVTSDPFLGALSVPHVAADFTRVHPPFEQVSRLLASAPHLYPSPCPGLSERISHVSVFNAELAERVDVDGQDRMWEFLDVAAPEDRLPIWLFVISSEDHWIQVGKHGESGFAAHLIGLFESARLQGKQAVLVAPSACVAGIIQHHPADHGAVLRSFCSHRDFTALMKSAESAFYWNIFSNSLILRLSAGRPAFFFDVGHLVRNHSWLYKAAVDNYFLGWQPVCLDQQQALTTEVLRMVSAVEEPMVARVRDHLRSSPSPSQAVASLLGRVLDDPKEVTS